MLKLLFKLQSILRTLLPGPVFRVVKRLGDDCYKLWTIVIDEVIFLLSYVYNTVTINPEKATRIKSVWSVKPYSLVDRKGLLATYDLVTEMEGKAIEGSIVECGVARGGCSALMAMIAARYKKERGTWLFDSFEGVPEPTENDPEYGGLAKGSCLGTYDEVDNLLFSKFGLDRDSVFMVKGWFEDTLPKHKEKVGAISLLRVDADWYDSTKCCLQNLYGNVVPGGYIVIDDYGALAGCRNAVDEFLKEHDIKAELIQSNWTIHYFVKPNNVSDASSK